MITFCTVATPSTSVQAGLLGQALRRHHPEARMLACATRTVDRSRLTSFEIVDEPRVDSPPALLAHALESGEIAVYLDPTVDVHAPLSPVVDLLDDAAIVLIRRTADLPEDGERPDAADLIDAGRFTAATVGVRGSKGTKAFLDWWRAARLQARERRGEPADGRLLSLAHERFSGIAVCDHPGCAVSHWNLHERALTRTDGGYHAGGAPLVTFDFEGFRADRPFWLSERSTRVRVVGDGALSELCGGYAETLRSAGWTPPRADILKLQRLGNGQLIDSYVQRCWRRALDDGLDFGDPLHPESADAFADWMREPADKAPATGINRYLYAVYDSRPDLHVAFPDINGTDGPRLIQWGLSQAGHETLADLVPFHPDGSSRSRIATEVIGFLGEASGLAEAARLYVGALEAARVPVSTRTVVPELPVDDGDAASSRTPAVEWRERSHAGGAAFNLACINGDHLATLVRREGASALDGRPTIGQWGWETDVLPPSWEEAFTLVDEVWVYSQFMAQNLGRLLPVPVVVVPPPIVVGERAPLPAGLLGDDRFTFVSMVDLFSTLERKNPGGLIEAFVRAFSEDEGPRLLIKTINAGHRPQAMDELRFLAQGRRDISFADLMLSGPEKTELLSRADCYVSLHRSEGFGLPLAEAMAVGTPVIATGYSGNLDFMTPANSLLVDWRETYVGAGSRVYPAHGRWAEPDLDDGARLLRQAWESPAETASRADRARVDIERLYSPRTIGLIARARLELLAQANTGPTASGPSPERVDLALDRIEQALSVDPAAGAGGATGFARRSVLRLIRPFTFHERAVDRSILEALRTIGRRLDR